MAVQWLGIQLQVYGIYPKPSGILNKCCNAVWLIVTYCELWGELSKQFKCYTKFFYLIEFKHLWNYIKLGHIHRLSSI